MVALHLADWWWLIAPLVLMAGLTALWLWLVRPPGDEPPPG